jgi:hypothetical protein
MNRPKYLSLDGFYMRPDEADTYVDNLAVARLWGNMYARLFFPLTTLWIFALSTGEGVTAMFFRNRFLVETLSPTAYLCFLFHQMVAQWYFAATRGMWWDWWRFRKTQYWFSPNPCPVEWYEYFYVVALVVVWSKLMAKIEPTLTDMFYRAKLWISGGAPEPDEMDTIDVIMDIVEGMTGIEPEADFSLADCGLASISMAQLVGLINKRFSRSAVHVQVSVMDMIEAETIADVVVVVTAAKEAAVLTAAEAM